MFGSNQNNPSTGFGFGSNTSQGTAAFGSGTTGTGTFGTNTGTSGTAAPSQSRNVSADSSAFGQTPPAFGQRPSTGLFGSGTATAFGQPQQNTTASTFGAPGAFGSNTGATSAFGSTTGAGAGLFGSKPAASGFGTGTFGSGTTGFGSTGFGSTTATTTPGAFGTSSLFGQQQQNVTPVPVTGSQNPAYQITSEKEQGQTYSTNFHAITMMPAYRNASFEELRIADYAQGRRFGTSGAFGAPSTFGGTSTGTTGAFGGFGTTPTTAGTTSAFGQPAQTTASGFGTGFGSTPAGGFGTGTAAFGQTPSQPASSFGGGTTGAFGSGTTGFGSTPTTGFGSTTSGFGSKPGGFGVGTGFGATTGTTPSGFGTTTGTGTFGTPQTSTGAFGASTTTPSTTWGGFGSSTQQPGGFGTTTQPQETKPAFGGFGTGATTTTPASTGTFGTFGQKPAAGSFGSFGGGTGAFGTTTQTPAGGSLFGGTAASAPQSTGTGLFGTTGSTGGFGSGGSLFGAKPATSSFGLGGGGGLGGGVGTAGTTFGSGTSGGFGGGSGFGLGGTQPQASTVGSLFGTSQPQEQQQTQLQHSIMSSSPYGSNPIFQLGKSSYGGDATQPITPTPSAALVPKEGKEEKTPAILAGFRLTPGGTKSRFSLGGAATSLTGSPLGSRRRDVLGLGTPTKILLNASPSSSAGIELTPEAFVVPKKGLKSLEISRTKRDLNITGGDIKGVEALPSSTEDTLVGTSMPSSVDHKLEKEAREKERQRIEEELRKKTDAEEAKKKLTTSTNGTPKPKEPEQYITTVQRKPTPPHSIISTTTDKTLDLTAEEDGAYWTIPTMSTLLSSRDLRAVSNFVVGRKGYGQVRFSKPVDLSQVRSIQDVPGTIVVFELKICTVYPDETLKPPVGKGLNVPATITLEKCWPLSKETRQPILDVENPRFIAHVERLKRQADTEFIDYIADSGSWIFKVKHFSSWACPEDGEKQYQD